MAGGVAQERGAGRRRASFHSQPHPDNGVGTLPTATFLLKIDLMDKGTGELVFEVVQEQDGGFVAECLSENIITEADTWEELRENVKEAVAAFFFDQLVPTSVRLHLVRDELLAIKNASHNSA
jgi:hypothetical protein